MIRSAAVVGLGCIGGSLARDLAARGVPVAGWDAAGPALAAALACGVVTRPLAPDLSDVGEVDVLVLAVPVLAAAALVRSAGARWTGARLVTDVGSTKRSVVRAAVDAGIGARFVGAHPVAGDHRSGWGASREGLFAGARVHLVPAPGASDGALRRAHALWSLLGARAEASDAAAHDRLLAWSSHLPQAVSSALANALAGAGVPRAALGPGGRDVARLAGSSPEMWAEIAADNAGELAPALAALEAELRAMRRAVEARDVDALGGFFAAGRRWGEEDAGRA